MARHLTANVWVGGVYYAAGSTPPKEVADQITNPKAWGDKPDVDEPVDPAEVVVGGTPEPSAAPVKKAAAKKAPAKKTAAK